MIDRKKIMTNFAEYTEAYDSSDDKIKLKIVHTYRVAALCERIARSLDLSKEDTDLAWACGMLHDIGRFEQIRRYGTFEDAKSVDHAQFGADLLFGKNGETGIIHHYIEDERLYEIIETSIRQHNAFALTGNMSDRMTMFCHILRDADKIDILRVNVDFPLESIYNTTTEILRTCTVTPEVEESFLEHKTVLRALKKTPVDNVVGHISLVYGLVYPESMRMIKEQGYLDRLMNFESNNQETQKCFARIRSEMTQYLAV